MKNILILPVQMGCKQPEACSNNKKQNFVGHKSGHQCRPDRLHGGSGAGLKNKVQSLQKFAKWVLKTKWVTDPLVTRLFYQN